MVTKKRTVRRARRRAPVRRAAPRRRAKSGITYIPSAMATVALVAANAGNIKEFWNAATNNGKEVGKIPQRIMSNQWTHNKIKAFVTVDNLTKSAIATAGGYVGGEIVKKYAPGVIKRPLGKIAKKIPKVI